MAERTFTDEQDFELVAELVRLFKPFTAAIVRPKLESTDAEPVTRAQISNLWKAVSASGAPFIRRLGAHVRLAWLWCLVRRDGRVVRMARREFEECVDDNAVAFAGALVAAWLTVLRMTARQDGGRLDLSALGPCMLPFGMAPGFMSGFVRRWASDSDAVDRLLFRARNSLPEGQFLPPAAVAWLERRGFEVFDGTRAHLN